VKEANFDRAEFCSIFDAASTKAGLKFAAPVRRAVLDALSERDASAALCLDDRSTHVGHRARCPVPGGRPTAACSVACLLLLGYNQAGGGIVIPVVYALPDFLRGVSRAGRPAFLKTDKELYRIFEVAPEWVFELAGLPSPGKSTLKSVTVKALERRADGVIVPEAPDQPLTIVEFQFQADDTIYRRTVVEMAAVQDAFPGRVVQGLIFFGYNGLDPQTVPWTQVVRSYVLPDVLREWERKQPKHPLVAVFKPLLAESEEVLRRQAAGYFRAITHSSLSAAGKASLEEVFVSWLVQRFKDKTRKEIEMMLLGELPELEETVAGKELIQIGEKRGWEEGLLAFLAARHGAVPAAIQEEIAKLTPAKAKRMMQFLARCQSLDEVTQWLARAKTKGRGSKRGRN
jgi:predicted transposase YdaD